MTDDIKNMLDSLDDERGYEAREMIALNEQLIEIEALLHTSTLDDERRQDIERRMNGMSHSEADKTIEMLYNNQQATDKEMFKRIANYK